MLYQLYQIGFAIIFLSTTTITAWPTAVFDRASLTYNATDADIESYLQQAYKSFKLGSRQLSFNPGSQFIPTTGRYAFQPPNFAAGDQRGNCPGLNALANHGYIPRNGVTTTLQVAEACNRVYGMGTDLSLILSTYGTVMSGDLTRFSIGGPTPLVPGLLGLLGTPQGISAANSHNKYEGDASLTRGDLYIYGEASSLVMSQFKQFFDTQPDPATANYDMTVIIPNHAARFLHSIQNNPYFFNAPLSGVIAASAAHNFVFRMFANHSTQYPNGILNQEVLKSFFAISGPRSNFVYNRGWERIPSNWYRRPNGYTLPAALADILATGLAYPPILSIGGNLGRVNTFSGVNVGSLTGGAFNAASLLQGNNLMCFTLQAMRFATPDLVSGPGGLLTTLLSPVVGAVNKLVGIVGGLLGGLSCPRLNTYDRSVFASFAGSRGA